MTMFSDDLVYVARRGLGEPSAFADTAIVNTTPPPAAYQSSQQSGLPLHFQDGLPVRLPPTPLLKFQLALKRAMDIVIALVAIIGLAPVMMLVAAAVKVSSPGPALFGQTREGINGTRFCAWKFRSMRIEMGDVTGVQQTQRGDPRVTPVGRFIRKTSIDELPQLFNVLMGQMSIVGPRPHVPDMLAAGIRYDALVPYYADRLQMAPGITGWAQANGYRGLTDTAEAAKGRVDHDLAYIQNFSIMLDLRIIVLTAVREFVTGSGH